MTATLLHTYRPIIFTTTVMILLCQIVYPMNLQTIYTEQAQHFIKKHILDDQRSLLISPADFNYLLNIIYFSYLRSHLSLEAKQASLNQLHASRKLERNGAQTMRDPWHTIPYPDALQEISRTYQQAIDTYNNHFTVGDQYSHAVFNVNITRATTQKLIKDIRSQSRDIRKNALLQAQDVLTHSAKKTAKLAQDQATILATAINSTIDAINKLDKQNLADDQSFTRAYIDIDEASNRLSEQNWDAFIAFEQFTHTLWKVLEENRELFYKSYYIELHKILSTANLDPQYKTILFDRIGVIAQQDRTDMLPALEN
jgi:hypothetical protein